MEMSPASSNTCRCLLRLPSVSAHSCFSSPNVKPCVLVIKEVSTLRRACSWMTRSSPSYANVAAPRALDLSFFNAVLIAMLQSERHQQLPHSEWNTHGPGKQLP